MIFFWSKTLSGSTRLFEKRVAVWRCLLGPTCLIGGQDAFNVFNSFCVFSNVEYVETYAKTLN